jgi:hypothetical protein
VPGLGGPEHTQGLRDEFLAVAVRLEVMGRLSAKHASFDPKPAGAVSARSSPFASGCRCGEHLGEHIPVGRRQLVQRSEQRQDDMRRGLLGNRSWWGGVTGGVTGRRDGGIA